MGLAGDRVVGLTSGSRADPDAEGNTLEAQPDPPVKTYGRSLVVAVAIGAALAGVVVGYLVAGGGGSNPVNPIAEPSASLEPPVQLKLGESGSTRTGSTITVLTWDRGAPGGWPVPPEGWEFSHALVRFCSGPGVWNFRVREIPYLFNLVDSQPDAERPLPPPIVDTWHTLGEFASYSQAVLSPDECVAGAIVFASRTTAIIRAVRFTGHNRFEWDVADIANGTSPAPTPSYSPGPSMFRPGDSTPTAASPREGTAPEP